MGLIVFRGGEFEGGKILLGWRKRKAEARLEPQMDTDMAKAKAKTLEPLMNTDER